MNVINVIYPYRHLGQWVFDDAPHGLAHEPFVAGADTLISGLVLLEEIPDAESGFTLLFAADPFPGHQAVLVWQRVELGGNWYYCETLGLEGWLCPALLQYFEAAPERIYVQMKRRR